MMIKETIVVEGKDDIRAVKAACDCHVIQTGGTRFGAKKIEEIRAAREKTGIIVLADPDYAGHLIREKIDRAVPGAKHAYLPRRDAQKDGRAGVEHADPDTIRNALAAVRTETEADRPLQMTDLYRLGLAGQASSAQIRRNAGRALSIGDCNAARFLERVNRYGITEEEITEAIRSGHGR